jgi:aconitate hydratase
MGELRTLTRKLIDDHLMDGEPAAGRVQYVDHNLLQADEKNAEDHTFPARPAAATASGTPRPATASRTRPPMQRFGKPGRTLAGSDSHTCAGGSLGMLAIGVGGLEVALAIAGEPLHLRTPEIWGVRLTGSPPSSTTVPAPPGSPRWTGT